MEKKIIKKVADVACINLNENEIKKFEKEFNEILENFKILDKVNTKNVKPSFHPFEIKNIVRQDKVKPGLTQKQALSNTKNKEKGFFKGPKVV